MAYARIVHRYTDGSLEDLTVAVETSFPDAVDEAVAGVLRMYHEVFDGEPEDEPGISHLDPDNEAEPEPPPPV